MTDELPLKREMTFTYGEPRELCPGVVRIVANNPGPFTFKGTNTYLLGRNSLAVIDPGPEDAAQCAAILKAAGDRPITHIVVTHTHHDHVGGLTALQQATGALSCGFGRRARNEGATIRSPSGGEYVDRLRLGADHVGAVTAEPHQAGLRAECQQGRDMGFDGKSLIHPAQIEALFHSISPFT